MATTKALNVKPEITRLNAWEKESREWKTKPQIKPSEELFTGTDLKLCQMEASEYITDTNWKNQRKFEKMGNFDKFINRSFVLVQSVPG